MEAARRERLGEGIALVTVTHDSQSELEALLDSVSRHLPHAHVVVVDSGSIDRSAESARAWPGQAEVLELDENVGFGRANNAGLRRVGEPVTVLVNPDVELLDDSLAELAAGARRGPDRLLAPLVLQPDGSRQDTVQHEPACAPLFASALVPPGALPARLQARIEPWHSRTPRRVGWAVGCCLVARTDTLRRLGPFDEGAFLFAEDLDLGLRAADAGIETWFWPAARVVHKGGHSTSRAFGAEAFDTLARRRREVVADRRGQRRARLDDLQQALTFYDRIVLKTLLRRPAERERRQLAALRRARIS